MLNIYVKFINNQQVFVRKSDQITIFGWTVGNLGGLL